MFKRTSGLSLGSIKQNTALSNVGGRGAERYFNNSLERFVLAMAQAVSCQSLIA